MKKITILILVMFGLLIACGKDSDKTEKKVPANEEASKSLWQAANEGNIKAVEEFLAKGADVNYKYHEGETVLNIAVRKRHLDIARLLIDKGANINAQGYLDRTALMNATWVRDINITRLLLERNADVNIESLSKDTALTLTLDYEITRMLVDRGADVNHFNQFKNTALFNAASFGQTKIVEYLLGKGADLQFKTLYGKTPLMIAKERNHSDIVSLLEKAGAKE